MSEAPPLGLTMGEPAGIAAEITLKAWLGRAALGDTFVAIDDAERLRRVAAKLGFDVPIAVVDSPEAAPAIFAEALPVLSHPLAAAVTPGQPDAANAPAVIGAIDRAVDLVQANRLSAVVTNPIHKKVLYDSGFRHPGHTEYLAALAGTDVRPVMMLACPQLRVVPVTIHLALRSAVAALDTDEIVRQATVTAAALKRDFAIARPRLAVAGLNPHAGEEGALGDEEITIIAPAVAALRAAGIDARGPTAADALFHDRARETYDVAICMYHDQALVPLKTLDVDHGVNITLGLPFVRTSPDHGTAFDIAGDGRASESSLLAALVTAGEMAERRRRHG